MALFVQVDAAALHHQNQRLVQQLEAQKTEMHTLEEKFKELREEQDSYDKTLITVNKMWNQVSGNCFLISFYLFSSIFLMQDFLLAFEFFSKL